ncbi:hypothetical protein Pmani_018785 [Petrolisthes manimaculis]|uniref:Uncharacterized protein n=1 Tax=Petrolisthes manimaculis TaxID=1843537 RepID=A0AAE1U470_9EUCA|nr:hypothetical protein Pmani_018785 [Petrolisthes manimaculis]
MIKEKAGYNEYEGTEDKEPMRVRVGKNREWDKEERGRHERPSERRGEFEFRLGYRWKRHGIQVNLNL